MEETKPFKISKQIVKIAFERVKANKGTYGIDEQTIADFEENLKDNLYKIWNRMSSGTYFPKPGTSSLTLLFTTIVTFTINKGSNIAQSAIPIIVNILSFLVLLSWDFMFLLSLLLNIVSSN